MADVTTTEGVLLTVDQHNALLRVGDAIESIPFCSDPECHARGGCHIHRLDAANAAHNYVLRVLRTPGKEDDRGE